MPLADPLEIDELLALSGEGCREVLRALMPLIYDELRRVARQQLRRAPLLYPLQTTAFVHVQARA